MTTERIIRIMAGAFILISLALGVNVEANPFFHSVHWLWVTLFVGLNLFQSGFTNFCPPEKILKRFGVKSTCN